MRHCHDQDAREDGSTSDLGDWQSCLLDTVKEKAKRISREITERKRFLEAFKCRSKRAKVERRQAGGSNTVPFHKFAKQAWRFFLGQREDPVKGDRKQVSSHKCNSIRRNAKDEGEIEKGRRD